MKFEDRSPNTLTYKVTKKILPDTAVQNVTMVNDTQLRFLIQDETLLFTFELKSQDERFVIINVEQEQHHKFTGINAEDKEMRAVLIRFISDVRDMILSRHVFGRKITTLYYMKRTVFISTGFILVFIVILSISLSLYYRKHRSSKDI